MTFDKSGQDTSLNVRVGVQVPQRGVTWFHLCIMDMVIWLWNGMDTTIFIQDLQHNE